MNNHNRLSEWAGAIQIHFGHLSLAQVTVLAMWSFGMVIAQSCGTASVACILANILQQSENTVRQRLREGYLEVTRKRGRKRKEVDVTTCFVPLLRWILAWWAPNEQRLVLVLDASTLGQRFTLLAISVVYRGSAIPVAWAVVPACHGGAWKPHWERLLGLIAPAVPASWMVLVMADRGLYAKWLYKKIQRQGWHPFLRINHQGNIHPDEELQFRPLKSLVPTPGTAWHGTATCFSTKDAQLPCTVMARWDDGYTDPWIVLTDLPPDVANVAWYGMRTWIEHGFKASKRGGWHWEQTKMTDPARAERMWLHIALATLWVVSVGGKVDATLPASSLDALPETHIAQKRACKQSRPRMISCFRRGMAIILAALVRGDPLPMGQFIPEPWPEELPMVRNARGHPKPQTRQVA